MMSRTGMGTHFRKVSFYTGHTRHALRASRRAACACACEPSHSTKSKNDQDEYREAQASLGQQHRHVDTRLVVCVIHIKLLAVVIYRLQELVVSVFVVVALNFPAALVLPQRP